MRPTLALPGVLMLLSGCQMPITPDPTDTTPPRLVFQVHYLGERISSEYAEFEATGTVALDVCLYVARSFRVVAHARDPGGIRRMFFRNVWHQPDLVATDRQDHILSIPAPAAGTWADETRTYPNPGGNGGWRMHAVFDATKAYRRVAFYGGFKFAPEGTHGHLVAEAQNFGLPSSQLTQAWRLYVRKAEDVPGKRPGSRCDVPA